MFINLCRSYNGGEETNTAMRDGWGFELRLYFSGWTSRLTCYPLGHLNIPALRGVKKRYL